MSTLFRVLDVEKRYAVSSGGARRELKALDGVRLEVREGESIALVGESGSGKSTLVRVMLGLEPAFDGRVLYRHADLQSFDAMARRRFSREVALVYQDARGSMNPRMRVEAVLGEPLRLHRLCRRTEVRERVAALLERVGLPRQLARRYPGELSGGQVRRVAVARALAAEPCAIFADESVAGLDVSVQAQLLNLLRDQCRALRLTLVFVTHDLGVASYLCDRIAVMYLGRIVELGDTREILSGPKHPYTRALLRAFPSFERPLAAPLKGEIPSAIELPPGCRFAGRCPEAREECRKADPPLSAYSGTRDVACFFPG